VKYFLQICGGLLFVCMLGCATCSSPAAITDTPPLETRAPATTQTTTPYIVGTAQNEPSQVGSSQDETLHIGYTQQQADGNRFVVGQGQIPDLEPLDIPLPGKPSWVVAVPWDSSSLWAVALEDGRVLGFQVDAQGWQPILITPTNLNPGQPPILVGTADMPSLLIAPSILASPLTHAIPLYQSGLSQVYLDTHGDLFVIDDNLRQFAQIDVDALPDARVLQDEDGRLLLLSSPTEHYDHGVLGDAIEAESITRVDNPATGDISALIELPENLVIEGIAPIWADLNGDGLREIIVTASNAEQGAQILVFNEAGERVATGPAIGQGYRWRHQIAVAPFGPNTDLELVDVLTPHLGGVVTFYRWEGEQLQITAQLPGYTSHIIGTRNLDMAAAGDFDGDGRVEVLLPNQARTELAAIRRTGTDPGAEVVWSLALDGEMITNLGAVTLPGGDLAIGMGQENGILPSASYSLRIWHP
jgi:hypothetical protein